MRVSLVQPIVCRSPGLPFAALLQRSDSESLWKLLDDPEFVDTLATMHAGVLPSLRSRRSKRRAGHRNSNVRRSELTLYRYLARFCSRNDTTGTAGSTFWGSLGPLTEVLPGKGKERVLWVSPRHGEVLNRTAAHGAFREKAVAVLSPRLIWTGDHLVDPLHDRRLVLNASQRELLETLIEPTQLGRLPDPLRREAEWLLEQNLLLLRLGRPEQEYLDILAEAAVGTPLQSQVEALKSLQEALGAARSLEFAEAMTRAQAIADEIMRAMVRGLDPPLPAAEPWREAADWLAIPWPRAKAEAGPALPGYDRSFFLCDSARNVEKFTLGTRLRERIEGQLAGWFRLAAWQEFNRERLLLALLQEAMPVGSRWPLQKFLLALHTLRHQIETDFENPRLNEARFQNLDEDEANWTIESVSPDGCLHLAERRSVPAFEAWLADKRLVTTLDLMLGGSTADLEAGRGSLLISESHCGGDGLGVTSFYPQAHAHVDLRGHSRSIFGEHTVFLQPSVPTKQTPGILLQLQDNVLALTDSAGAWPGERTVSISRLEVRRDERGVAVWDGSVPFRLITDSFCMGAIRTVGVSPSSIARWATSLLPGFDPRAAVRSYPEVRLGDLILARSAVHLSGEECRQFLAGDPSGKSLQAHFGLPRFTFATTNKKPMLCDFESSVSVEVLAAEVEGVSQVRITHMSPAPEQLWLHLEDGAYASELRMVAVAEERPFRDDEESCYLPLAVVKGRR